MRCSSVLVCPSSGTATSSRWTGRSWSIGARTCTMHGAIPARSRSLRSWGSSPFPRRPLVLFVACRPDPGLADWARRLVNDLLPHDVEGRLALTEVPPGVHLTRPCLPSAESIQALSPDIVVALDARAAADVPAWCTERKTVIIEFASDPQMQTELVSWRVGQASGRLRARIGRGVTAPELARLVSRLCAGPQPVPPSDTGAVGLREARHSGSARRRPVDPRRRLSSS